MYSPLCRVMPFPAAGWFSPPGVLIVPVDALCTRFLRRRLLLLYFSLLPVAIPGVNALVVQASMRGATIACSTLFVHPGHFDTFPTRFGRPRDIHEHVIAQPHSTDHQLPHPSHRLRWRSARRYSVKPANAYRRRGKFERAPSPRQRSQVERFHVLACGVYGDVRGSREHVSARTRLWTTDIH
ncbi:hypothetical protein BC827DRAFT_1212238 [Russula dissimulans]|nr:hypothetical protein BC827DRAFT_1212238 [Russula dissimulans]